MLTTETFTEETVAAWNDQKIASASEAVFAFLNRNYGRIFINRAPADEIVAVLTVSRQDADALVAYRKTAGAFADFEAIRKVPGIDIKKLENKKDAIAY